MHKETPDPHRILYSKAPQLTREFIDKLSTAEAWKLLYSLPKAPRKARTPEKEICFTGFAGKEHQHLIDLAKEKGFRIVESVTMNLTVLCTGLTPGPKKLEKAKQQNAKIITAEELPNYCKNLSNTPTSPPPCHD